MALNICPCGSFVASSVRIIQAAPTTLHFTFSSRIASSSILLLDSATPLRWVGTHCYESISLGLLVVTVLPLEAAQCLGLALQLATRTTT